MESNYLLLNSCDLNDCAGIGLDIGGSQAKIAYIDRSQPEKDGMCTVRFKLYPRDNITEVIEFVKSNCNLSENSSLQVYGTGFGSCTNKSRFEKELNIKLKVIGEFDSFAKAVVYRLKNYPVNDVVYPRNQDAENDALDNLKQWKDCMFSKMNLDDKKSPSSEDKSEKHTKKEEDCKSDDTKSETKDSEETKDKSSTRYNIADYPENSKFFPCIMVSVGSGTGIYMVTEDGTSQILEGSFFGGRSILGMANLLLGTNDFNEIMMLAETGTFAGVDTIGMDLINEGNACAEELGEEAKAYTSYPEKQPLFFLGKAATSKGPFKREDIAASLINCFVYQLNSLAFLVAAQYGFSRIYFSGGFTQNAFARKEIETGLISKLSMRSDTKKEKILYGFIRNGESFGALGALLHKQ